MLNIITAIKNVSNINDFSIFSLLDWRNKENKKQYEELQEKLNISIHNYSLIAGTICEETKETLPKDKFSSLLKDDTFLFIPCTLRDYSQIMRILFI